MKPQRYPCPCCGFLTLQESPPGTFEICPVCYWEDDDVQFNDPSFSGGSNCLSLEASRENYKKMGAISEEYLGVVRGAFEDEKPET